MNNQIKWYDALPLNDAAGYFLLKDGSVSPNTIWEQEAGVFINNDLYIPKDFGTGDLPNLYGLFLLQEVREQVKEAFSKLSISIPIPKNVVKSLKSIENNQRGKKRIVIKSLSGAAAPVPHFFEDNKIVVFDNFAVFMLEQESYKRQKIRILATAGEITLFTVKDSFLFSHNAEGTITLLGTSCKRICDDIIQIGETVYQFRTDGTLKTIYDYCKKAVYFDNRLQLRYEYFFFGADHIETIYIDSFKKIEGEWINTDRDHILDIAENM